MFLLILVKRFGGCVKRKDMSGQLGSVIDSMVLAVLAAVGNEQQRKTILKKSTPGLPASGIRPKMVA
jgi:hypothetical protein